jgi:hypothetical protein
VGVPDLLAIAHVIGYLQTSKSIDSVEF